MTRESLPVVRDGYILSGAEGPNQFRFYRNDFGVLGNIPKSKVLDFYQTYVMREAQVGKKSGILEEEISFTKTEDGKCILITVKNVSKVSG